jgi:hypothetical protein
MIFPDLIQCQLFLQAVKFPDATANSSQGSILFNPYAVRGTLFNPHAGDPLNSVVGTTMACVLRIKINTKRGVVFVLINYLLWRYTWSGDGIATDNTNNGSCRLKR